MFGMGFMEIFLVLIVAIIALGPEKLPGAMVETVKFFKKIKGEFNDAKSTIDKELNLSQLREDANELKASVSNIKAMANVDIDEITKIEAPKQETATPQASEKISDLKQSKKETISITKEKEA